MKNKEAFATGLHAPASIEPLPDGRILISDTWGDQVMDISEGGDVSDEEPFATDLQNPYSLCRVRTKGDYRLYVTENLEGRKNVVTDVTGGGPISADDRVVDGVKSIPTAPGITPMPSEEWTERYDEDTAWQDQWHRYASGHCGDDWITSGKSRIFMKVRSMGHVTEITDVDPDSEPTQYKNLVEQGNVVGQGLGRIGGIKYNEDDGFIYGAETEEGELFRIDPDEPHNHRFTPPLVTGLSHPSCLRLGPDSETLYACDQGDGVVWKITDF